MNTEEIKQKTYDSGLDEGYYQRIPNILINDVRNKIVTPLDVVVYAVFANRVGKNGRCWVSNKRVADEIGRDVRTVQHCIKRLAHAGHILRPNYSKCGTKYTHLRTKVENGNLITNGRKNAIKASCGYSGEALGLTPPEGVEAGALNVPNRLAMKSSKMTAEETAFGPAFKPIPKDVVDYLNIINSAVGYSDEDAPLCDDIPDMPPDVQPMPKDVEACLDETDEEREEREQNERLF